MTPIHPIWQGESKLPKQLRDASNLARAPVRATQRVCLKPGYEKSLHIATPGIDSNTAQTCSH